MNGGLTEAAAEQLQREHLVVQCDWEAANTDRDGFFHGWRSGEPQTIEDDVPDNAHWKGWVW